MFVLIVVVVIVLGVIYFDDFLKKVNIFDEVIIDYDCEFVVLCECKKCFFEMFECGEID